MMTFRRLPNVSAVQVVFRRQFIVRCTATDLSLRLRFAVAFPYNFGVYLPVFLRLHDHHMDLWF
jgi:hypothetical protein